MMLRAHRLKIRPDYFNLTRRGYLSCQLRRADRDFRVGDYLVLVEFNPENQVPTGQSTVVKIEHILRESDPPHGLSPGFVLLSTSLCGPVEENWLSATSRPSAVRSPSAVSASRPSAKVTWPSTLAPASSRTLRTLSRTETPFER